MQVTIPREDFPVCRVAIWLLGKAAVQAAEAMKRIGADSSEADEVRADAEDVARLLMESDANEANLILQPGPARILRLGFRLEWDAVDKREKDQLALILDTSPMQARRDQLNRLVALCEHRVAA